MQLMAIEYVTNINGLLEFPYESHRMGTKREEMREFRKRLKAIKHFKRFQK